MSIYAQLSSAERALLIEQHDAALVHHANELKYLRDTTDRLINQFAAYAMRTDQELERLKALCEGTVHG